jgi:hypothetical protein
VTESNLVEEVILSSGTSDNDIRGDHLFDIYLLSVHRKPPFSALNPKGSVAGDNDNSGSCVD